ncbi:MAG: KGG domain-containing protein [Isosphaeraceae bacterium]
MDPEEQREIARKGGWPRTGPAGRGRRRRGRGGRVGRPWLERPTGRLRQEPPRVRRHGPRGAARDRTQGWARLSRRPRLRVRGRRGGRGRRGRARLSSRQGGSGPSRRGFAAMDPEEQREIASEGGREAHRRGTAHEFDSEEAAEAGRKGGEAVSRDREHMAEIGRKGGQASHHRNAAFYHESAAHHHRQAARHHASGDIDEAEMHARTAHGHSQSAHEHSRRGFAAMDPEEQREISRKGGQASHGGRGRQSEYDEEEDGGGRGGRGNGGGGSSRSNNGGGMRGGSSEQHARAGRQSHKND